MKARKTPENHSFYKHKTEACKDNVLIYEHLSPTMWEVCLESAPPPTLSTILRERNKADIQIVREMVVLVRGWREKPQENKGL